MKWVQVVPFQAQGLALAQSPATVNWSQYAGTGSLVGGGVVRTAQAFFVVSQEHPDFLPQSASVWI